jgi:hypothetical protein
MGTWSACDVATLCFLLKNVGVEEAAVMSLDPNQPSFVANVGPSEM